MTLDPHFAVQFAMDHRPKCKRLSNKLLDENREENLHGLRLGNERLQAVGMKDVFIFLIVVIVSQYV